MPANNLPLNYPCRHDGGQLCADMARPTLLVFFTLEQGRDYHLCASPPPLRVRAAHPCVSTVAVRIAIVVWRHPDGER